MGFNGPSFLDTEKEHKKWHRGLYRGLKVNDPRKLYSQLKINDCRINEWWRNDNHYHDIPAVAVYGVKATSLGAGLVFTMLL